jgi:hypothetical protein
MHRVSDRFLTALRDSHTVINRVDAYAGDRVVMQRIPFSAGSVDVSSGTGVHRKLTLSVSDPSLWDLLSPIGIELRAYRGIRYPGGDEELVPLGVFSLDQASEPIIQGGELTFTSAPDRFAYVQRARFETPRVADNQRTAVGSIADLITEAVPCTVDQGGVTTANPLSSARTALQVWSRDRDQAITGLCTQAGVEAFFGPTGALVIRDVPVQAPAPVWRVDAGKRGVMIQGTRTRDRSRVYNVVVVVSSVTDGTAPFAPVVVEDTDVSSPTNVSGPYGRCPVFLTTSTITNKLDAYRAGQNLLAKVRGRYVDITVDALVNPALEAGDTISVQTGPHSTALYLLDSFSVPLGPDGSQSLTLRSLAAVSGDVNQGQT